VIYFVEALGADAIKIGYTRGLADGTAHGRVSTMQSNCPLTLKLLATMPGGYDDERELHVRFSDDWIRGDWFRASAELRAFISQFPEAAPPPRAGDPRYNRKPSSRGVRTPVTTAQTAGNALTPAVALSPPGMR
jgi:hypothetical protein